MAQSASKVLSDPHFATTVLLSAAKQPTQTTKQPNPHTTMSLTETLNSSIQTFTAFGLTEGSAKLLANLAWDAPNWSGSPMIDITKAERGNLSNLKKKGLLTTETSDGVTFAIFTEAGKALIKTSTLADCIY